MKVKKIPMRMCVACRTMKEKKELLRIVRGENISVDTVGKVSGRGAYICRSMNCFEKAIKSNAINRALEVKLDENIISEIKKQIEQIT